MIIYIVMMYTRTNKFIACIFDTEEKAKEYIMKSPSEFNLVIERWKVE